MSPGRRSIVPVVLLFTVFLTLEGSLETWGPWGSCSNSCGSGSQSRSRACNNTAPLTGGTNCSVTLSETQSCNVQACPSCSGNVQADIVFVMDDSSSVVDVEFEKMKEFVRDQVDVFDIGSNKIRVGVLKFSSSANTEFNLNSFYGKDAMKNRIMNIGYTGGTTNTGDALSYMRTSMFTTANGDREGVHNIGVIITDGQSNNFTHTADHARAAHNANITTFSIGISSGSAMGELSEMASKPDSDYLFTVANFSALSGIHTAFQAKACVPGLPVFHNCGGHLSGQGSQIVSPNFPDHYPNNSVCTWTLTGLPETTFVFPSLIWTWRIRQTVIKIH
ncbi:cartilage matrix protein-like [Littorina saxatilis]|uniref:Uncharacterized protein n=1 Tax=Littorina saxatilis TaxID=31220 RepID=A0AAN9GGP0_9CAEN